MSVLSPPSQSPPRLTIITLNAFNSIPEPFRYNGLDVRSRHFCDAVYHSLGTDFDVLLLQEFMWKRDDILKGFIHHPYHTPIIRSSWLSNNIRPIQSGLCIVSKYPLVQIHATLFNGPTYHVERLCAKGAVHVRIRHPLFGYINVINTHLNAWTGDKADRAREYQINHIATWEESLHLRKEEALIYGGDLNICAWERALQVSNIMERWKAQVTYPVETQFSFDPKENPLVGLDAPAEYATLSRKNGCSDSYLKYGKCICAPRQLVDLLAQSTQHTMAIDPILDVVEVKTMTPFLMRIQVGVNRSVSHISDHHAVRWQGTLPLFVFDQNDTWDNVSQACKDNEIHVEYDEPRFDVGSILMQLVLTILIVLFVLIIHSLRS